MSRRPRPRPPTAFTIWEIVVVVIITAALIGILIPALSAHRRVPSGRKHSSGLRAIHQGMVIYATSNNTYLPGLDQSGAILPDGPATGYSGNGAAPGARFWLILNGQYIGSHELISPQETLTKWTAGPATVAHYSYAMLQITDTTGDAGRRAEWRDNEHSLAAYLSDRNIGGSNADAQAQSLWTQSPGKWNGYMVWGDNHAEFVASHFGLHTRYHGLTSTNDNLFLDGPTPEGSPATERGTTPGSNAMMVWY